MLMQRLRFLSYGVLLLLVVPLGAIVAVGAFFGAAYVTSAVPVLVAAAVLAQVIVVGWVARVASRGMFQGYPRVRRWLPVGVTAATLLLVALAAGALVFQPMDVTYVPKEPTDQTRYWDLPTGSRLAYVHTPAEGQPRPTPVVMLHGGPGAPGDFGPHDEDGVLAAAGFDVYRYDQIGAGASARLADVREYSVERHVADLDHIRQAIGAERMILVGGSWGGTLAAHYAAAHPDRVERMIVSSPGAIWAPAFADGGISTGPEMEIITEAITLRFVATYYLQQINPQAARNFASDEEMSGFFQPLIGRVIASDVGGCDAQGAAVPPPAEPRIPRGFGFYANMITAASVNRAADPRPALANVAAPVLILRGECDRIRWEVTQEYHMIFADSTLIVVDDASHSIDSARATVYAELLHAFVLDQPLPLEPYQARHMLR